MTTPAADAIAKEGGSTEDGPYPPAPQVHVNGKPASESGRPSRPKSSASSVGPSDSQNGDGSTWGANFWVTLIDPQTGVSFFACPATGEVSWDPPVGNFLLPPSPDGEWWEMTDEGSGLPYYYHTKTGETVWERPQAFVIPLGVLQNTALARRLSLTKRTPSGTAKPPSSSLTADPTHKSAYRRSRSYVEDGSASLQPQSQQAYVRPRAHSTSRATGSHSNGSPSSSKSNKQVLRRSASGEKYSAYQHQHYSNGHSPGSSSISPLAYERGHPLAPIPGSPYNTDASPPSSPSKKSGSQSAARVSVSSKHGKEKDKGKGRERERERDGDRDGGRGMGLELHLNGTSTPAAKESPRRKSKAVLPSVSGGGSGDGEGLTRTRSSKSVRSATNLVPYRAPQPQSLNAALEKLALSSSGPGLGSPKKEQDKLVVARDERAARHSTSVVSLSASVSRASEQGLVRRLSTDPAVAGMGTGVTPNESGNGSSSRMGINGSALANGSGSGCAPRSPSASFSISTSTSASASASASVSTSTSPPGISPTSSMANGKFRIHARPLGAADQNLNGNTNGKWPAGMVGKAISSPVFDPEATQNMSPVKMRNSGRPILVEQPPKDAPWDAELGMYTHRKKASLNTGTYPVLPDDLQSDIQQFSEMQFARQYFSTHRTGFIFRRRIPVEQMMTWQKSPLSSPLLQLNKPLHKEAIKTFKSLQRVMGDRDREKPAHNGSTTSLSIGNALLEEERSLLSEGLSHGELRDEIYCQVMKQLTGNPNPESAFKGWQLLCVLLVTFPPSKNFEHSLRNFLQRATYQPEGRVDVMAKYCLRRLAYVSRKGPRGKPPTLAEIETASDAAFHPSIFGESLDAIFRLQERNYPQQQVPIILPFLSDGILALGGTKAEGIFRVPGDGDAVSELKLRIDKGYYTLDGFDDPNVLASLLKLWLRELADPLIPDELYNDCITDSHDPGACVMIIHRLPTINRRVVLFVVSFLQLFLEEKIQAVTKMTAPNLALVMAPNLLRCSSDSMAVVFTNAQYEQTFVHNLLLHLKCDEIDPDYVPTHGHGAIPSPSPPVPLPKTKASKTRHRSTLDC